MNKFNFKENLDKGIDSEDIIKMFFNQISDKDSNSLLNSLVIEEISCLPLPNTNYKIYAVCSQSEIDRMISFDDDYVYYEKTYRKINPSCKGQIYNISYRESWGEIFGTFIECFVIKKTDNAMQIRDYIIAKDRESLSKEKSDDWRSFRIY